MDNRNRFFESVHLVKVLAEPFLSPVEPVGDHHSP